MRFPLISIAIGVALGAWLVLNQPGAGEWFSQMFSSAEVWWYDTDQ